MSINRSAFSGTGLKPGMELGSNNRFYQLVTTVPPLKVGQQPGAASYQRNIGGFFTIYALARYSISRGFVFKTVQGKLFEGLRAKLLGGSPFKSL